MDSTMLLMDAVSSVCALYCAYTWVRLLRERRLFKNELLLGKDKKPEDCLDEEGYVAFLLPRLGLLTLALVLYAGFNLYCDLSGSVLLPYPLSFLPLAFIFAVLIWYVIVSTKANKRFF